MKKKISIVLPCLNEEQNLTFLIPEIIRNIPRNYGFEIICVDDGSVDRTFKVIRGFAKKDKRIKGIRFYKWFGHQQALIAGIRASSGDAIISLDADFQHPPKLIPKILLSWKKGHDLVLLKKAGRREENFIERNIRKIGYALWMWISGGVVIPGVSDFRLMDKKVAKYLLVSKENEVFLRGLVNLAAKNPTTISYKVRKRRFGKSGYTLGINTNFFINGLVSFSIKPLRVGALIGLVLCISSTLFLLFDFIHAVIVGRRIVEGWLTIVFLMLILNGFIIFYLGILAEYVGVIFNEAKKRPKYIIQKRVNL